MTLGVLLLLTASHTGMKEGIASGSFRPEAFWEKISAKARFSYLLKRTVSTGILRDFSLD